jgi:GMP synthase-like glutamine amidotransferase
VRLLAIVHETDSGPALLADAARERGIEIDEVLASLEHPEHVPTNIDGYDLLLVLGASPSVNDDHIAPWFHRELALIRDADANSVPILGVCFGAQALAVAMGGSVARATNPEIGWLTVDTSCPEIIEPGPWLEWHVDAIAPPPDAVVLATTSACVQAYTLGRHLAVQFHPEVTDQQVSDWVVGDAATVERLGLDGPAIVQRTRDELPAARVRAARLFDRFLAHAAAQPRQQPAH